MVKKAIITGVTGQDGYYLTKLLLQKKYLVYGITNPKSKKNNIIQSFEKTRKLKILSNIDINNYLLIKKLIKKIKPDEFYHLAAQSYVNYKFEDEFFKLNPNINGTHYILSSIKDYSKKTKFYFAASSELFGNTTSKSQNENTKFNPRSAYGVAKSAGFYLTKNYREAYNLFACSGILFNHESPRRNKNFVTRKVTSNLSLILKGRKKKISFGNINSKRDWGHAKDYVFAMWKILQQKKPEDYVVGTGKLHSVKDFIKTAFEHVGLDYKNYIKIDKKLFRHSDNVTLKANIKKAQIKLKWKPKISFKELVREMVDYDIKNTS